MDWNNNYLSDFGFIWSRVPEMEPAHYEKCKAAFAKHAVDTDRFNQVEHGPKCDYDLIQSVFMPPIPDFLEPGSCPLVNEKELWESQKPKLEKVVNKLFLVFDHKTFSIYSMKISVYI